jgi:hypothetical protein
MIFSGLNNDLLARDGLMALDMKVSLTVPVISNDRIYSTVYVYGTGSWL